LIHHFWTQTSGPVTSSLQITSTEHVVDYHGISDWRSFMQQNGDINRWNIALTRKITNIAQTTYDPPQWSNNNNPYAPCMVYLPTKLGDFVRVNVGKYSSTMEHMGNALK